MSEHLTQLVYTTADVAALLSVRQRTVSKWCDTGKLHAYRIPGSQDRRITKEHLTQFLKTHGLLVEAAANEPQPEAPKPVPLVPAPELDALRARLTQLEAEAKAARTLRESLTALNKYGTPYYEASYCAVADYDRDVAAASSATGEA